MNYLKPYPVYKDSGLQWLGKVPEHWSLSRTKTLLRERIQKGFPNEPLLAATQTKGVVFKEQYENRTVIALKDLELLKLVKVNDFVISLRSFQGGIEYCRAQGIISPAYTVLYPINCSHHGFLAWLFKSQPYVENLTLHVTGIRQGQNIDYVRLSRSNLPLPPLSEQTIIVRYLDYMDRRIRRYIYAKKKLIALLNEQKQAIIHQTVTRGLDPNVHFNPSGIKWLGDVPGHWEVRRLKHLGKVIIGLTYQPSDVVSENEGTLVLRSSNIQNGRISLHDNVYVKTKIPGRLITCIGDILICSRSGSRALIGKNAKISPIVAGKTFGVFMTVFRSKFSEYLYYVFNSRLFEFQSGAFLTSTINELTAENLNNFQIPFPSVEEQIAIVGYLDRETSRLDKLIKKAAASITFLNEYRTRLIADVVTGKLDVREAAASLPEEMEEEPLEEIEEADMLDNSVETEETVQDLADV